MSKIQWTEETSNPIYIFSENKNSGHWCKKISEGCANCYAETINNNNRFAFASRLSYTGKAPANLILDTQILDKWKRAKKFKLIFPFSMTDWMGDWIPMEWSFQILDAMAASKLTFQTLTKRADRLETVVNYWLKSRNLDKVPSNIWLGISAENQAKFDERIEHLVNIPCDVRWLSCEPLLEEIQLGWYINQIQWIVVGGESGKNARECHLEWIEDIISQAESKVFVKQLGSNAVYYIDGANVIDWKTKHSKGGNIEEFPEHLKIRQLPC